MPRMTPAWSTLSSPGSMTSRADCWDRRRASRRLISALIIAKGAHRVIAHGMPTTPTATDASVGVWITSVENMANAKINKLIIQARRSVSHGIIKASRALSNRVVYDLFDAALRMDIALEMGASYVGATKNGRSRFDVRDVMAQISNAKVPTLVPFS